MEEIWNELYKAAKAVQKEIKISDYVTAGEVSAAIESESGRIYCIPDDKLCAMCCTRCSA